MDNYIKGYKAFNIDHTNNYGKLFKEGLIYHSDKNIKYGTNGIGFHFAKNLEDTLRFQLKNNDTLTNPAIAKVIGFGNIIESFDDYYGYYDLYVCENILIKKFLTREEIIEYAIKLNSIKMERFVSLYKLSDDEIKLFESRYKNVDMAILYYQKNIKDIYQKEYIKKL